MPFVRAKQVQTNDGGKMLQKTERHRIEKKKETERVREILGL